MTMNRRNFIRTGAMSTVPIMLNGLRLGAMPFPFFGADPNNDRILVLIQLNGGNDGLNSIIPLDQYSGLSAVRSNILIPESAVLPVETNLGFHPAMAMMRDLYMDGKMGIVQSVGYPNQDRSHFRSTDIWTTGSHANEYLSTGWLGRYFNEDHADYPDAYPNADYPDPFALTMGSLVSETCQGPLSNFSLALNDPFALAPLPEGEQGNFPNNNYGNELRFLVDAIAQTNAYASVILDAAENGSNNVEYPTNTRLANQLQNVALLISGGLKTKVYIVSLGGFDTHSGQVDTGSTLEGTHAQLMQQLSETVHAFQQDLKASGYEEKVLTMTFSEFGRQIRANDSLGTDHGNAAPLMLFGPCVKPGVLGENPQIGTDIEPQAGVPMQYDFRSVYATVLRDWLGVEEQSISGILNPEVQYLPILEGCTQSTATNTPTVVASEFNVYPNPATSFITLEWLSNGRPWEASLLDKLGYQIQSWQGGSSSRGRVSHRVSLPSLPSGHYYIHLRQGNEAVTRGIFIQ